MCGSAELQEAFKQRNVPDLLLSIQKHIWILAHSVGLKALDCWLLEEECSTQCFLISSWDYWKELLCDFQNVILKIQKLACYKINILNTYFLWWKVTGKVCVYWVCLCELLWWKVTRKVWVYLCVCLCELLWWKQEWT